MARELFTYGINTWYDYEVQNFRGKKLKGHGNNHFAPVSTVQGGIRTPKIKFKSQFCGVVGTVFV